MIDEKNWSYKRVSDYLIEKDYRTIRSNKLILPNYVYSIYKKGKIRENRIGRDFNEQISNIILFKNRN